ncbi:hypothetical protein WR25_17717 [Diploscapter pachys]|uniref:Uncharacterized protein n=1 Tax=Diploscapter pachys TaxID=2018661 RepID=A0A2A2JNI2_9BILA|nr:hypothetical protein WR25_17717 [Diploscapter pachys]
MAAINDWLVVESNSQGETNEEKLKGADGRMGAKMYSITEISSKSSKEKYEIFAMRKFYDIVKEYKNKSNKLPGTMRCDEMTNDLCPGLPIFILTFLSSSLHFRYPFYLSSLKTKKSKWT